MLRPFAHLDSFSSSAGDPRMSAVGDRLGPDLDWARAIDMALHPGGPLRLAFQPIVDLRRGVVAGYEVLARFELDGHPPSPLPWLGAAAEHGRLVELEQAILSTALASRRHLPRNTFLSVNLSAGVLLQVSTSRLLLAAGDLRGLVVEITEHERVLDYDALRTAFAPAAKAGAMLGVDDVGSGYASLGHVLTLRPSFVKLDRTLVMDLDRESHRCAAVAAIGALTDELDGWVVAEGIERRGELDALARLGVPLGQGYFLGRPAREMATLAPELATMIRDRPFAGHGACRIGAVVEDVLTRQADADGEAALTVPAGWGGPTARSSTVVIVDPDGAPVSLEIDGAVAGAGGRPMCVMADEHLADVALRAVGRAADERLLPIVCCDDRGNVEGVVPMDRLIDALARQQPRD
jgi:EAL domain-containing protein (putative c-di-GMP-specific phosphodiesterase class I)